MEELHNIIHNKTLEMDAADWQSAYTIKQEITILQYRLNSMIRETDMKLYLENVQKSEWLNQDEKYILLSSPFNFLQKLETIKQKYTSWRLIAINRKTLIFKDSDEMVISV